MEARYELCGYSVSIGHKLIAWQFFITLAPTPWLDGKHTIFGRVSDGIKIVKSLGMTQTDRDDKPTQEIKIISAYIVEKEDE
jgi:peptidyl-prolyl cis-trans isomerase-like 1